mmetsp:Transcript_27088/g.78584  ORF Transcript_27088/g.78584 Transcript_27088/m.78584 type:complete len:387 (-) Transcript_27088:1515-2675(-)
MQTVQMYQHEHDRGRAGVANQFALQGSRLGMGIPPHTQGSGSNEFLLRQLRPVHHGGGLPQHPEVGALFLQIPGPFRSGAGHEDGQRTPRMHRLERGSVGIGAAPLEVGESARCGNHRDVVHDVANGDMLVHGSMVDGEDQGLRPYTSDDLPFHGFVARSGDRHSRDLGALPLQRPLGQLVAADILGRHVVPDRLHGPWEPRKEPVRQLAHTGWPRPLRSAREAHPRNPGAEGLRACPEGADAPRADGVQDAYIGRGAGDVEPFGGATTHRARHEVDLVGQLRLLVRGRRPIESPDEAPGALSQGPSRGLAHTHREHDAGPHAGARQGLVWHGRYREVPRLAGGGEAVLAVRGLGAGGVPCRLDERAAGVASRPPPVHSDLPWSRD